MAQFTMADIPGAVNRGLQFRQQQELRPLEIAQAQQAIEAGNQRGQFSRLQQTNLQQQIDQRTDAEKNKSLFNTALKVSTASDADIIPILQQQIERTQRLGGNADESIRALELAKTGDFEGVRAGANNLIEVGVRQGDINPVGGDIPADQQSFENLIADFSPEDKIKAKRIKAGISPRAMGSAIQTIAETGTAPTIANVKQVVAEGKETGKLLAQHKLKPVVESAVVSAVGKAKAEVKKIGKDRSNDKALNVYTTAMDGLTKALDNTITGPFIGLTPALTSNAQIADGAVSMMLPLMKDVFRGAGEGTFTDADQKILTDLIPTRNDTREARSAKIIMIDSIIRAKLANAPTSQEAPAQQDTLTEAEQAELQQLREELGK